MSEIEVINPLDATARLRWHRKVEEEGGAETPVEAMTDIELAVCILHDPDLATRRKALNVLRLKEYTDGVKATVAVFQEVRT